MNVCKFCFYMKKQVGGKSKQFPEWYSRWGQDNSVIATIEWWDKVLNKSISPVDAYQTDIDFLLSI